MTSQPDKAGERGFAHDKALYQRTVEALGAYGWTPLSLIPSGSGFRVETPRGPRFLKRFRFGPQEIHFVYDVVEHLRSRGFDEAPRIYLTRGGDPYVHVDGEILYLQEWHDLSPPDLADPGTLRLAAQIMARLHAAGERYRPPSGLAGLREEYGSWLDKSVERLRELYGFAELAGQGRRESKWDSRYAKAAPAFCRRAEEAVRLMAEPPLRDLASREREAGAVCHRNFVPRNLALDGRTRLCLLDFDSCSREIRLDDLAKFVRRAAGLDLDRAAFILQCYSDARGVPLVREEIALIGAYLLFPTEFWAVGRSRYQREHQRDRMLRWLVQTSEQWARFASAIGGLELPAEPMLVPLPQAMPTGGPLAPPDVPDGPHLPAAPDGPDKAEAVPLGLLRMDLLGTPPANLQEVSFPMSEETPIYQAWPAAETCGREDEVTIDQTAAIDLDALLPPAGPGTTTVRRLVWEPLPQPAQTVEKQTAALGDGGEQTAAVSDDTQQTAAVSDDSEQRESEPAEAVAVLATLAGAGVPEQGAPPGGPPAPDGPKPVAETDTGVLPGSKPVPGSGATPGTAAPPAPAAVQPGPKTLVWGKWPAPAKRGEGR